MNLKNRLARLEAAERPADARQKALALHQAFEQGAVLVVVEGERCTRDKWLSRRSELVLSAAEVAAHQHPNPASLPVKVYLGDEGWNPDEA